MYMLKPLGTIYSPFKNRENTPKKSDYEGDICKIVVAEEYEKGLEDIDEFSYIYLICFLDRIEGCSLIVHPSPENKPKGVFSTRSPSRPNPLSLTRVKLLKRERNVLYVQGIDVMDNTPLIDIKPYTGRIPKEENIRYGWYEKYHHTRRICLGDHQR